MKPGVCNHGFWLTDCSICVKRPDECDYGSCTSEAIVSLGFSREGRRACGQHVEAVERSQIVCDRLYCNDTIGPCDDCPPAARRALSKKEN